MNIDEPTDGGLILPGMARRHRHGTDSTIVNRLPILRYLPHHFRSHFVAMSGEFVGTFLFLFFAFSGTQVANTQTKPPTSSDISQAANPAQLLYISLCFGFSLAVNAWVFFRISGGLFNPAVTLGLCLVGAVPYVRGSLVLVAQLLGGIAAAGIVAVLFPGPLSVKTTLRPGASITQGLFIEMFLTAQLVFTIFMLAAEKHKATFIAPVGIGLSLFIAELSGKSFTRLASETLLNSLQASSILVALSILHAPLVLASSFTLLSIIIGSTGLVLFWVHCWRHPSTKS
jgi:aquaporin related protein